MQLLVIHNKIYEIRGQKIMLDFDIAELYEVETKVLNQAVKRNKDRFPKDFMFRLSKEEWELLRSQIVTLEKDGRGKYPKYLPFAFAEHGVTMLASVLRSETAIKMNIAIVRAFNALPQFTVNYKELAEEIKKLSGTVDNHSGQLKQIYDALENLLDEKVLQKKWDERESIGFKTTKKL